MNIQNIHGPRTPVAGVHRNTRGTGRREAAAVPPGRDTLELSERAAEWLEGVRETEPAAPGADAPEGVPAEGPEAKEAAQAETPEAVQTEGPDAAEDGGDRVSGKVGINAAKLARMLAAARTRSQIRSVMAKIQQDLRECEDGKARGMDVDEAGVQAAENLLNQARQRMGQAKDGEASPEDEAAFALASLF